MAKIITDYGMPKVAIKIPKLEIKTGLVKHNNIKIICKIIKCKAYIIRLKNFVEIQ
jgi:hypothetical protein